MGLRGPAPTPTSILELRGSWKTKMRTKEPKPTRGKPPCPPELDDRERGVWRKATKILDEMNVLTVADGNLVARYCVLFVRWWDLQAFIKKYGMHFPIKNEKGDVKCFQQFPEVGAANKTGMELLRIEQQLGLTPAARTSIHVIPRIPVDARKRAILERVCGG